MSAQFEAPRQLLDKQTYLSEEWFAREKRDLFDRSWVFACLESDVPETGDYITLTHMNHPLMILRDEAGELKAFHNICRHRGCEVLEGHGNTGIAMVCPYHRWTYKLDGELRGVPNEEECFGEVDRSNLGLHPASVGAYKGMVFVNPSADPAEDFTTWIANMDDHAWPHDLSSLKYEGEVVYEMLCNWKVFYENAIDGYHLGYLHDQTLGKVYPSKNIWEPVGRNVVWYSTERDGQKSSNTLLTEQMTSGWGAGMVPGAEQANFPGVVMMFPLTILSPSPWGFYISILEPVSPGVTNMRSLSFGLEGSKGRYVEAAKKDDNNIVRLADLEHHPLESGNFQIEDMWIVEKIQRNLTSPHFKVGPLAAGDGAEGPITHFQASVLDHVSQN